MAFLSVTLELHNPVGERTRRRRREAWGAEGVDVGMGCPPLGGVWEKNFDFGFQYGEFWCILGGLLQILELHKFI